MRFQEVSHAVMRDPHACMMTTGVANQKTLGSGIDCLNRLGFGVMLLRPVDTIGAPNYGNAPVGSVLDAV